MFEGIVGVLTALIVASAIIEAVLEFLVVPWVKLTPLVEEVQTLLIRWLGGVLGVLVCVLFGMDLLGFALSSLGAVPPYPVAASWVGAILTGLLSGRGANWLHDFGQRYFGLDGAEFPPYEE